MPNNLAGHCCNIGFHSYCLTDGLVSNNTNFGKRCRLAVIRVNPTDIMTGAKITKYLKHFSLMSILVDRICHIFDRIKCRQNSSNSLRGFYSLSG